MPCDCGVELEVRHVSETMWVVVCPVCEDNQELQRNMIKEVIA